MTEQVKVIGVSTRPTNNLNDIYVAYFSGGTEAQVIKVLFANMQDTSDLRVFSIMDDIT